MASSLLALLDDIATILDDVAVLTKVAAKKTAGVLGRRPRAQRPAGGGRARRARAARGVGGGQGLVRQQGSSWCPRRSPSAPSRPGPVTPLLMIGGAFLCFEGFEKLAHKLLHSAGGRGAPRRSSRRRCAIPRSTWSPSRRTRSRARSAPTSSSRPRSSSSRSARWPPRRSARRSPCWSASPLVMTVGVYGLVAGIVKLDDFGLHLTRAAERGARARRAAASCAPRPG